MPKLRLPRLRADQYAIGHHPAKRKNLAMGRRWGKTVFAGCLASVTVAQHGKVAWVVPTYKNARAPWRWLQQVFGGLATAKQVDISKAEKVITTPRGGYLGIYSGDNIDAIRGDWFHLVINDECSLLSEEAIYDAIEPTLADVDGDEINVSTPRGRTWFWREWQRGHLAMDDEAASWTAPTSANPSPQIRKAFGLAEQRLPDRTFRQEWLAEFIDESGGVFRGVRKVSIMAPLFEPIAGHQYICGVDWGKNLDYTAMSVIDLTTNEQVWLERSNSVDYVVQRQRLATLHHRYQFDAILAEKNSIGDPIIEQLQRDGLPVRPFVSSNASKAEIIEALQIAIEREQIKLLDDAVQIHELEAYEMKRLPSGLPRYEAPEGLHDDTVMALAIAWYGCVGGGIGVHI